MSSLIAVAKIIGGPGSLGFFILCATLGLLFASGGRRGRRVAKIWLSFTCGGYFVAALPFVARTAADGLETYSPVLLGEAAGEMDAVVVLSGDNPLGRARQARNLLVGSTPRCIVVSGDRWFVRMLSEAGVARERLTVDNTTTTTREQVARVPLWAQQCGAQRVVLVASTLSIPRVAALARSSATPVVLSPSPLDEELPARGIRLAIPSRAALRVSRDALYEHAALAYYRYRKWIS